MQTGCQPQTPLPAQPLCVLSSVRSDDLEGVHLLHMPVSVSVCPPGGLGLGGVAPLALLCREHSDGLDAGEPPAP